MKNLSGFSLIELLVVVTVSGVVGILMLAIFSQNNGLFVAQTAKISQGLNLNDVTSEIRETIRSASFVSSSYTSGSNTYTSGTDTLVLATPSLDNQGFVIAQTYDFMVIEKDSQNPKVLKKLVFPNAISSRENQNMVLAIKLSKIIFLYYDNDLNPVIPSQASRIEFTINLEESLGLKKMQISSASAQVSLRND